LRIRCPHHRQNGLSNFRPLLEARGTDHLRKHLIGVPGHSFLEKSVGHRESPNLAFR
jgi:hypothetical protein